MATLTVNPQSGTTVQGSVSNSNSNWSTCRGATDGNETFVDSASINPIWTQYNGVTYKIKRGFFLFDTSSLGAGATISSAVISFAGTGTAETNDFTDTFHIVSSSPASNTTLDNADFDQVGSTSFGSMNVGDWAQSLNTYNNITLNASGIAAINKTGITKFATRTGLDLNNTTPGGAGITAIECKGSGVSNMPKLVITYTTTNIKTVNGLDVASVKTVNGLAIASVKSINGLT